MAWLDAFRPLPEAVLAELRPRYEMRLPHHSLGIEGSTLTQSETQIVIGKGITIGGKSINEHLEVECQATGKSCLAAEWQVQNFP